MDVFHFSEDSSIQRFEPHVPATNPEQPASVWAIDAEHAPLYWFPRHCPRVATWPRNAQERVRFQEAFHTTADRIHAVELRWLPDIAAATLFRYRFDATAFRPWPEASGQWISDVPVEPIEVEPIDDLLGRHIDAAIELRAVPDLHPLRDLAITGPWDFSIVRLRNAARPDHSPT